MESRAPALKQTDRVLARRRLWTNLAKTALGVTLLAALVFWGRIDLNVLLELAAVPWAVVTCLALLFLALPLAALRWGIFLRALGVSIPFVNLFHFVAIGVLTNVLLLGSAGGDAVRGLYAWRRLAAAAGASPCRSSPTGCSACSPSSSSRWPSACSIGVRCSKCLRLPHSACRSSSPP